MIISWTQVNVLMIVTITIHCNNEDQYKIIVLLCQQS